MSYWEERARELEKRLQEVADETVKAAKRAINRAYREIDKEIAKLADVIREADPTTPTATELYERSRRLEAVKKAIDREFRDVARAEEAALGETLKTVMEEGYYHTIYNFQRGTGIAFSFAKLPTAAIKATLSDGWLGSNYSKRVWKNAQTAANAAKEVIQSGLMTGASVQSMTAEMKDRTGEDWRKAERLIRTEVNFYSNQGELAAYEESGIEEYEFLATLDSRTSEVCQEHDGKRYPLNQAAVGENYPPLHPNCRSTTVAVIEGFEERIGGRAARDKDGKNITVPADMSYPDWKKKFVDGNGIMKNIEVPSDVNEIKGFELRMADEINATIQAVEKDYDLRLDRIDVKDLGEKYKNVPLQFQTDIHGAKVDMVLGINSGYNFSGLENKVLTWHEEGVLAAKDIKGLAEHELAHVLTFQDISPNRMTGIEGDLRESFVIGISKYSDKSRDGAETIAEAFVRQRSGESISKEAKQLLSDYIEKWRR